MASYRIGKDRITELFNQAEDLFLKADIEHLRDKTLQSDLHDLQSFKNYLKRLLMLMDVCETIYVTLEEGEVLQLRTCISMVERLEKKL